MTKDAYKAGFTVKQFTAFTLAANWAFEQHETLIKTQHFFNLMKRNMKFSGDEDIFKKELTSQRDEKGIIKETRNYFSHYIHPLSRSLTDNEADDLNNMVRRLVSEFINRGGYSKTEDDISNFLDDPASLFHFKAEPIVNHAQAEIAFMLALFLSKGQMAFLWDKIFFGENAIIKQSDGADKDAPKTSLQKKLLNILAQPDNIIMRRRPDGSADINADPWLDKKHEQGFAIWQLLVSNWENIENGVEPAFLKNGNYMMRQLVQFIELHNILPNFKFARIETVLGEVEKLEQRIIFSSNLDLPLAIRLNTIQATTTENVKGTFGLRTLIYIVIIFLRQKSDDQLAESITSWLKKNADYPNTSKQIKNRPLSDQIAQRLDYLLTETKPKLDVNLQSQIRFICQRINHVWFRKYDRYLRLDEYKELEKRVRYYRKAELRGWLEDCGLINIDNIQLGRGSIKTLKSAIKAEGIQQLYKDLLGDYHNWLQEQKDQLPKLDDNAQETLVQSIKVRRKRQSNSKPDFPVGLPESVLRKAFFFNEKNGYPLSLTIILQSLPAPFSFIEPSGSKSKELKKRMQMRNYRQLLLTMAWYAVKDLIPEERRNKWEKDSETLPDLADIPICINCGNISISMKFQKSWRNMAAFDKTYIGKLVQQYCLGEKTVPLFRADETKTNISIETARQQFTKERYMFMQALLTWEKQYCDDNSAIVQPNDDGFVNFACLSKEANLEQGTDNMRSDAFHNKVPDTRFSDCPSSRIKKIYQQILRKEDDK